MDSVYCATCDEEHTDAEGWALAERGAPLAQRIENNDDYDTDDEQYQWKGDYVLCSDCFDKAADQLIS